MPDSTTPDTTTTLPAVATEAASAAPAPAHEALFREAFARQLPAMMKLTTEQLVQVNLELLAAVTTVLGAWPEIRALRTQIARELPLLDLTHFDLIEEYALAAGHAQLEYSSASTSNEQLQQYNARATELRDLFLSDVRALVKRGLIRAQQVAEYRGLFGYRNVAFELLGLVGVLRQGWASISARTAVQPAELDEAERLARRMVSAIGEREQGPAQVAESAQLRQRAFTLLINAYDDARRAVSYLRWHQGDADSIVPSLYTGRPRKKAGPTTDETPGAVDPKAAGKEDPRPAPATPAEPRYDGMPGGSPFIS